MCASLTTAVITPCRDGTCMTYGDGDGTTFNPFVAMDVSGHELTHG